MTDDAPDPSLLPVPWHVNLYAAVLENPRRASLVLGLPFAAVGYGMAAFGVLPVAPIPPAVNAVFGWMAGSMTVYMLFTRPY